MADESKDPPASSPQQELEAARQQLLAVIEQQLEAVRQGRLLPPVPNVALPDWDLHERRLREMETVVRTGMSPAAVERFEELQETFQLDYQADVARVMAVVQEEMVRIFDDIGAKMEEKKFELPSDTRDELQDLMEPYRDKYREDMLGQLPIEIRRKLEEEAERRREGGGPPAD